MGKGLSNGSAVTFAFLALTSTWFAGEHIGPYAIAFAAEVRHGIELGALGMYVQEDEFYLRAILYFVSPVLFIGGVFSAGLWLWRSWTVIVTVVVGISWVTMAVFNNGLSYAIAHGAPQYPVSLYWGLGFYYLPIIITLIVVWSEEAGHPKPKENATASPRPTE